MCAKRIDDTGSAGSGRPPRHDGAPGAGEVELRLHEPLTCRTAPAFCRAVEERVRVAPRRLWINLEEVKASDVVGLAALFQTVRRAEAARVPLSILPSAAVYRALLNAGILDDLPLEGPGSGPALSIPEPHGERPEAHPSFLVETARFGLRPPSWDEIGIFERWANDPLLEQMVGSQLLYRCRHLGPYHPDFTAQVLHDPTALTLLVLPLDAAAGPVGFVRLYNVHLAEAFAFLETAVVQARPLRAGWGIEASRLLLAYAMDAIGVRRVEAKVYAYNVLSVNALKRNGFQQEGVLREARTYDGQRWDVLVFAMLEHEMREQRARDGFPYLGFWGPDADP
ncbi:MAG: GNAT family N-acetyltransferase [Candidatus Rokubacteria bacterium]|nr:GNAT family N-acetyltransferase [Candidatus Rokubacteria bacterium]